MIDWLEDNAFGFFLFCLVCVITVGSSIGGYYNLQLAERKLDILEKNGCATILVDGRR